MANETEYSRLLQKRTSQSGSTPTINTGSTIDGTWLNTDILIGELFINVTDDRFFTRTNNGIYEFALSPSGTSTYDFCATGIKTSAISGCSPVVIYTQFETDTSSATGTTAFAWGDNNDAFALNSFIGGGKNNNVSSLSPQGCIIGGNTNEISTINSDNSGIFCGVLNDITASQSFIAGGQSNVVNGNRAGIIAGAGNQILAGALDSFIGGGQSNIINVNTQRSSIIGGQNNVIKTGINNSSVIGGYSNATNGGYSSVVAGYNNTTNGSYSSVIAGGNNTNSGASASIISGVGNTNSGNYSSIIGGVNHTLTGNRSSIIGGSSITGSTDDTVYVPDLNIQDSKGIQFGTGPITTKVLVDLGDWDMTVTSIINYVHGLSATEWKTVHNISAIIRNDADTLYTDFKDTNHPLTMDSNKIYLERRPGGIFDTIDYDSTSYNRGTLTFWYTND